MALPPQTDKPAADSSDLAVADQRYNAGDIAGALERYQVVMKTDPASVAAESGMIRSLLKMEKIDEAMAAAKKALAAQPNSATLCAAMGDVQFRAGEMSPAELSYRQAVKLDAANVDAYLGLARIYRAYSFYGQAYACLKRAHEIAPDNPEVQRLWFGELPRKDRIAAIDAYVAGSHSTEETASLQNYLAFLKATAAHPHPCELVNKVERTDTKLENLLSDPTHQFGVGLVVKLNGHDARLQLDTGASGIVINRRTAERAGLTLTSKQKYVGLGDKGAQAGYSAVAENIRVGDLEFHDCRVDVTDSASVTNEDGMIGSDVFSSYVIDIDIPDLKLRLTPLPKRPEGGTTPATLKTQDESESAAEGSEREGASSKPASDASAQATAAAASEHKPLDRYVAPEMANWTPVFRFGHNLMIPTHVNDSPHMLFLIDTGSMMTMLSKRTAKAYTKLSADPDTEVHGMSGAVERVYRASKVTLKFGHLAQKNQDIISFDLSNLSLHLGTEAAGILGFETLHMLQIKIDYRDGLVDFVYDPKRWER
jgi:tetratricopeptide (TPR) repeat protein